jgi:Leucine-rich repeat (LRR) protein
MENLVELHIENQKLYEGEKMYLEPESLSALRYLQVLNISRNGIDNLDFIRNLIELVVLKCEDNNISDVNEFRVLKQCSKINKVRTS